MVIDYEKHAIMVQGDILVCVHFTDIYHAVRLHNCPH